VIKLLKWRSSELNNNLQKQEATKRLARLARKISQVDSTTSTYNRFFSARHSPQRTVRTFARQLQKKTSTVPTVETLLAGFTDLPRVTGEPTFKDIEIARQHLNYNCMNIQSYDGGGNHGHLGLVMTRVEYSMQTPGVAVYVGPPKPAATATIPADATPVAAQHLVLAHTEEMRAYRLSKNVDKACCKSILDALINYSHSRNPPCAAARTHGQIQAPREPPN
jgi:hypothetical protein